MPAPLSDNDVRQRLAQLQKVAMQHSKAIAKMNKCVNSVTFTKPSAKSMRRVAKRKTPSKRKTLSKRKAPKRKAPKRKAPSKRKAPKSKAPKRKKAKVSKSTAMVPYTGRRISANRLSPPESAKDSPGRYRVGIDREMWQSTQRKTGSWYWKRV